MACKNAANSVEYMTQQLVTGMTNAAEFSNRMKQLSFAKWMFLQLYVAQTLQSFKNVV